MITKSTCCRKCASTNIEKNGFTKYGKQKMHCKDCNFYGAVEVTEKYSDQRKEEILAVYQERPSMRGIARVYGVSRTTLAQWLKKKVTSLPNLADTLKEWLPGDVLELDELWSYVWSKEHQSWLWVALCRRTRQVVSFVIGTRTDNLCKKLWNKIPETYKQCTSYSDFHASYERVIKTGRHHSVGKETGETAHIERWNNTLRQRIGRFVRKTLSFSKKTSYHHMTTKLFVCTYNFSCTSPY